jgi:hypothetical protein
MEMKMETSIKDKAIAKVLWAIKQLVEFNSTSWMHWLGVVILEDLYDLCAREFTMSRKTVLKVLQWTIEMVDVGCINKPLIIVGKAVIVNEPWFTQFYEKHFSQELFDASLILKEDEKWEELNLKLDKIIKSMREKGITLDDTK